MTHSYKLFVFVFYCVFPSIVFSNPFTDNNLDPFLSDEFNNSPEDFLNSSSDWLLLHPERMTQVDSNLTNTDQLFYLPTPGNQFGWFQDQYGSLVYKNVTGNFAVVTQARVVGASNPSQAPTGSFNAGGFVIRNAAGTHNGDEHWVMFNFGSQGPGGYARELKKTIPSPGAGSSISNLFLTPQFTLEEQLLVCRINDEFRFYIWDEQSETWEEEHYYNNYSLPQSQQNPNGVNFNQISTQNPTGHAIVSNSEINTSIGPGERTPMRFLMTGIGQTLQVGIMGHIWSPSANNTRAEFDFVRFAAVPPTSFEECLSSIVLVDPLPESAPEDIPIPPLFLVIFAVGLAALGSRYKK